MLNRTYTTDDLQPLSASLSTKLRGLAFLFTNLQSSSDDDREAMAGVGELLRELAEQSSELRRLVEQLKAASPARKAAPRANTTGRENGRENSRENGRENGRDSGRDGNREGNSRQNEDAPGLDLAADAL